MNCIVVFTDSRGKGLRAHTNEHASEYPIPVFSVIRKGRTLRSCIRSALEYLDGKKFRGLYCVKYAIIIGGICDLTSINREGRARIIDYQHNEDNVSTLIDDIQHIYNKHGGFINIATIAPASLENHYATFNPSRPRPENLNDSQNMLLQTTSRLNEAIIECNKANSTETIDLARKTYSSSKKGRGNKTFKFSPKTLPDGVHAREDIQTKWLSLTAKIIQRESNRIRLQIAGERQRSPSANIDSSDTDTDAFVPYKRRKRTHKH